MIEYVSGTDASKVCSKCSVRKPLDNFYKCSVGRMGRTSSCKTCQSIYARSRYKNNPERFLKRHSLSPEDYERLMDKHNGACHVCGNPETSRDQKGRVKRLAIDHDHDCCSGNYSCGKCVRGLLCQQCNQGIGNMRNNVKIVRSAVKYLSEYETAKYIKENSFDFLPA